MRIRNNPVAKVNLLEFDKYLETKEKLQNVINLDENKNKKIYVEIGMGKGTFISNMAKQNPENLYIGVEFCLPVLAIAMKKIKKFEEDQNIKLNNLYVMSFDAATIGEFFLKNQIEGIYLNFSDPWPKSRHAKRRLTYKTFLEEYKNVLKENKNIEFKTDNRELFEFSLVSMQNFGLEFLEVYLDLHKTDIPNIRTEYEEKFSPKGPIYKLVAKMK